MTLQKREPCVEKGARAGKESFILTSSSLLKVKVTFVLKKPTLFICVDLLKSPRGRREEGNYIRQIKRSVVWHGPPWSELSALSRHIDSALYTRVTDNDL